MTPELAATDRKTPTFAERRHAPRFHPPPCGLCHNTATKVTVRTPHVLHILCPACCNNWSVPRRSEHARRTLLLVTAVILAAASALLLWSS